MKYKFYTTSEKAWLAMLEDIRNAKEFVFLESFILADDRVTHDFFKALKEKATEGVRVKIVVDRIGNFWLGYINKEEFERAGAEVLSFNRWFYRSHRKVLVIDDKIAYTGGVNVKGEYAKWFDLHVRLTGVLVRGLLHSFVRVYQLAGGKDPFVLLLRRSKKLGKARLALYRAKSWLIERWPIRGRSVLKDYYRKRCTEAQRSIVIATPYFIPHVWLIKSLRAAAKRGVRIDVIIPERTDVWLTNIANHTFAESLKDIINFFFIPEMNHAKVLLVDDREGMIGSNNIDSQSFDFNLESSVVFQRKDMVGDLRQILDRWKKMAKPAGHVHRQWYYSLIGFLIRLIQPIL